MKPILPGTRMPAGKQASGEETILDQLELLHDAGKLIQNHGDRDTHKQFPLTDEDKRLVRQAVQFCLEHDIAPNCSVDGGDASCGPEIVRLSEESYQDLVKCLGEAIKKSEV